MQAYVGGLKDFAVPTECGGKLLEGATFQVRLQLASESTSITLTLCYAEFARQNDGNLSIFDTALFTLFSALLADSEPSNKTYVAAATKSIDFVLTFATDIAIAHKVGNQVPLGAPPPCNPVQVTLNGGSSTIAFVIEAMASLHLLVEDKDIGVMLQDTLSSALDEQQALSSAIGGASGIGVGNGILENLMKPGTGSFEQEDGDMYLLRALAEARRRAPRKLSAALRESIELILGVHYNAIRDRATSGNNLYGRSWVGPPNSTFDLYNQAAAAQILMDGIDIFELNNSITPSPSDSPLPSVPATSKLSAEAIAGIATGSVTFLFLVAFTILCAIRRQRRGEQAAPSTISVTDSITPFTADLSEKRAAPSRKHIFASQSHSVAVPTPRLEPLRRPETASLQSTTDPAHEGEGHHSRSNAAIEPVANTGELGG
ncbi:hypothetical protein PQX77_000619 [Marasmius sp. AFHP31]|nr:hypothetical protein PQX77_000619 [Marasmius sp. AFHP31]